MYKYIYIYIYELNIYMCVCVYIFTYKYNALESASSSMLGSFWSGLISQKGGVEVQLN